MKKITIGFSKSSSKLPIFSWLIMLAQKNNFSHSYIRFNSEEFGNDIIFQASGLAINFMGTELFNKKEIIVKEFFIEISDETYNKLLRSFIDLIGQPYSLLQIFNSAIYIVCKKAPFDKFIVGWDCSKLVASILKSELGFNITEDLDVITPKDLYEYLESIYGKNN